MSVGSGALEQHGDEARCYAEPYEPGDAQRVLDVIEEYKEDGASAITIAKRTFIREAVVWQILKDLQARGKVRAPFRAGIVLFYPPLDSYDKSISETVSAEQDRSEKPVVLESPTRHKCLVTWCEHMIDKKRDNMRRHLMRTHDIPEDVAQHAQDLLREGKRIDLDAPRHKCQFCGQPFDLRCGVPKHERFCHKNPDRQANIDERRKRKYGPNAILGELTKEAFEQRDKKGVTCPLCGATSIGQGCYQRILKHIRLKHEKSAEEAREALRTMTWSGEAADVEESAAEVFQPKLIVQLAPDREMRFPLGDELYKVFSRYERSG